LDKKVALAGISDLFNVLLPSSIGQNLTFLLSRGSHSSKEGQKLANWQNIQKQHFRDSVEEAATPKHSVSPNFLEEQVVFSHPKHFKRTSQRKGPLQIQMESIMPVIPLKVTKAKQF
jgi:hypothetical protein